MAITNNAGFSTRDGASLSTDLGHALSVQLGRLMRNLRLPEAAVDQSLAGPSFTDLVPGLVSETRRR